MNLILDDLAARGIPSRRVSGTNGGEFQGPCPSCGGSDRFHVWPGQGESGTWWCRGCDKGGDAIEYLMTYCGKTFRDAAAAVGRDPDDRPPAPVTPRQRRKPDFTPARYMAPDEKWCHKAQALVDWAHGHLLAAPEQLTYLAGRGIDEQLIRRYRLGYNPGENGKPAIFRARKAWGLPDEMKNGRPRPLWIPRGIVIPLIIDGAVHRIRIRREKSDLTERFKLPYFMVPGSSAATMVLGEDARAFVVIEAELDAIACAGAASDICSAVAMGSSSTKPDDVATVIMKQALCILNALDFDAAGTRAFKWWKGEFPRVKRWPVPEGKDPGEAFEKGVDLRAWILAGLPPVFRIAGSTLLDGDSGKAEEEKTAENPVEIPTDVPDGIRRVAEWFRLHPVRIVKDGKRMRFQENRAWASTHPELSRRINLAVFMDPVVFEHVLKHPARVIERDNFLIDNRGEQ